MVWYSHLFQNFPQFIAKLLQSYLTLCDAMDSSPQGSSVHRILQARILEWAAVCFSNIHLRATT